MLLARLRREAAGGPQEAGGGGAMSGEGPGSHLRRDREATPGCLAVAAGSLVGSVALLLGTVALKLAGLAP